MFRRNVRSAIAIAIAIAIVLPSTLAPGRARADERLHRNIVDVEIVTIHAPLAGTDDGGVNSMAMIGYERVLGTGRSHVAPIVGAAGGFMELQGRAGALFDFSPEASHGLLARLELRPTLPILTGFALFGAASIGYRLPGGGYILPVVEGGPLLSRTCPVTGGDGRPVACRESDRTLYLGGTVAFGARF